MSSKFNFYPYPDDTEFNEKIYKKKEFYINKTKKVDTSKKIDELMTEKCTGFKLSDNQKFLKTFMSSNTPYNGLLLFHGTGVGKTCSSISIAEQYTEVLEKYNKKIIILLNPSIEDNFRKNIFNPATLKTKKIHQQCLGDKYLRKIKTFKNRDFTREELTDEQAEKIAKKVDNRIKAQYRFQGYQEFSNKLVRLKDKLKSRKGAYEKRIKDFFSNSVLIIDEAHNIKDSTEGKLIPKVLDEVLTHAEEMKLILLSATPMFNDPREIVFLLNLLLKNDKREQIDEKEMFYPDGSLTEDGVKILEEKSKGIVSYLRGENPLAFPMRLDPHNKNVDIIKQSQFPKLDFKGERINEEEMLNHLKLIPCVMEGEQRDIYDKIAETGFGAFENEGISISDVVFPGDSESNYQSRMSNEGFFNNFKKSVSGGKVKITPKTEEAKEMLKISEIGKYSTKMLSILKSISETKTDGIVFVYSRYVWTGVVMLGMLLEMEGFTNQNGNLLSGKYGQTERGDRAKYMIISGDQELSRNSYINYIKNEAKNKDGSRLKVILGSESASEGLDFKYIREVHILDPWHHLNKIEQVIGRGIRYCSHIDLPLTQRNVTVFMYVAVLSKDPSKDRETVDLKVYRDAENKDKNMADITHILKRNSVDCNLNLFSNKFTDKYFKDSKVTMVDSKGNKRDVDFSDVDNSRMCNYTNCDFKCSPDLKPERNLDENDIDIDTFDATVVFENINQIIDVIKQLYLNESVLELTDVVRDQRVSKMNVDSDFILLCLDIMVQNEILLRDKFDNVGKVISRGSYYIFVPSYLASDKISLREITRPLEIVEDEISLTDSLNKIKISRDLIIKANRENIQLSDVMHMIEELDLNENRTHYLPNNIKELLLKYLIKGGLDKQDELYKTFYQDSTLNLPLNILYRNDTVDFIKKSKKDTIFGYFLVEGKSIRVMEYSEGEGRFREASGDNKKSVINYLRRTAEKENKIKKQAPVVAYMELKKDKPVLKVLDKSGDEGKSKKSQSSGIVLTSQGMSKSALKEYIEQLLRARKYHNDKKIYQKDLKSLLTKHFPEINKELDDFKDKGKMYEVVEDLFIYNNTKEINGLKWFFTLEEYYISKL